MAEAPRIPGHRILSSLGEGGMGRVYLAEDEVLGRRVAVKVVSERVAGDAAARARFLREARAMAAVDHPNVVRVYSFGEANGVAYLVMEHVDGESLAARLRQQGRLGIEPALRIVRQAAAGLEAAWEQGLVHRDVKPSNLLIDRKGTVRVADFGLAKPPSAEGDDASLTATGLLVGTPHYVSPEQALGQPLDFRTDVYSLGLLLFEMLSGERPFEGRTPLEVVTKQVHDTVPRLEQRWPEAPRGVADLVARMAAKSAADRPASYSDLLQAIDALLAGGSTAAPLRPAAVPAGVAGSRWRISRRTMAGSVVLAALAGVLWLRWPDIRNPVPLPETKARPLTIAVAPFAGPDEDSAKEGRLFAVLVEKAVSQRLSAQGAVVIGVEQTRQPVKGHTEARSLGERLGASIVVWGEVLSVRGETEVQPFFTLVPRPRLRDPDRPWIRTPEIWGRAASLGLDESSAGAQVLSAAASSQIEARKTSASGVGDLVLMLAGVHALYADLRPARALEIFEQAPPTPESLRYRAEALLALGRRDEARRALESALALDRGDVNVLCALADLDFEAGDLRGVERRFEGVRAAGRPCASRQVAPFEGRLYARERVPAGPTAPGLTPWEGRASDGKMDTGYLVAIDPASGQVLSRFWLPAPLQWLRAGANELELAVGFGDRDSVDRLHVAGGHLREPLVLGASLLRRRMATLAGSALAMNFAEDPTRPGALKLAVVRKELPATLDELERALQAAQARDPTQPWHPYWLGKLAWMAGRREIAGASWNQVLAPGAYAATPYFEYGWMAADCERVGRTQWADRFLAEALRRRRQLNVPIGSTFLIERLMNLGLPYTPDVAGGLERAHLLLVREREFGLSPEVDPMLAAGWRRWLLGQGRHDEARIEEQVARAARRSPLSIGDLASRVDLLLQLCAAFAFAWLVLSATTRWRARRRRRAGARAARAAEWTLVTGEERRALLAARLALAAVAAVTFFSILPLETGMDLPIGFSDSPSSLEGRRYVADRLAQTGSDAARYVLACSAQAAGKLDEARQLYESVRGQPRAARNLEAVRRGQTAPPEWFTDEDVYELATPSWREALGIAARKPWLFAALLAFVALPLVGRLFAPAPRSSSRPVQAERAGRDDPSLPRLALLWFRALGLVLAPLAIAVQWRSLDGFAVGPASSVVRLGTVRWLPQPPTFVDLWVAYRDVPLFWGCTLALFAAACASFLLRARPRPSAARPDDVPTQTHTQRATQPDLTEEPTLAAAESRPISR